MKILMLTDGMESGGAESHLETLTLGLMARGHDVGLLSCGGRVADRLEAAGARQWQYRRGGKRWMDLWRGRRILSELLRNGGFEILHAHTRFTAVMMRGLAGKGTPRGSVISVHAAYPKTPLLWRLQGRGEAIVAVSEDLRARLCDVFDVPPERVSVIPNGVDCHRFSPAVEGEERGSDSSVLFASRLDSDCMEGAILLCQIAPALKERFPHLRIRIAGGGDGLDTLRERVRRLTERERWGEPVISLLGQVEDMASEYRRNSIFVGVSRAAMEAAASGCAVILCGNEGYGGILRESAYSLALGNFCCRGEGLPTAEALERDLTELLTHPREREDWAEAGAQWVRRHCSAEDMVASTEGVYRRLMEVKGGLWD